VIGNSKSGLCVSPCLNLARLVCLFNSIYTYSHRSARDIRILPPATPQDYWLPRTGDTHSRRQSVFCCASLFTRKQL